MAQADRREVSVVIPCLNEEGAIGDVIDRAKESAEACGMATEIIVVDNRSTDRSAEIARRHGATVIVEEIRGYGSAYRAGLTAAKGELILMADGDGTYDLGELSLFIEKLQAGNDLVIGSRFRGKILPGAMSWMHRRIGNPLLTGILNFFFGVKVSDAHCGMRALRKTALPTLDLRTTGMEFASEMILKASRHGLRIAEVPITYSPRVGHSKLNTFRDGWRHLRLLLLYSPTYLFLAPGALLFVVGLAVVVPLGAGPIRLWGREWGIHSMIVGATSMLLGFQVLLLGLFARTYAVLYLNDSEPKLEGLWSRVRLEHGLIAGGVLVVAGGVLLLSIFIDWASGGWGELDRGHPALLGMVLVGLGVQTFFGSFFFSILGLRGEANNATGRLSHN
jgi:glycosyltransferase involved in cell wall biosynthesis